MGRPRSSYTLWILGHVLRGLFGLLIFTVCAFLIWRMTLSSRPPRELRTLAPNDVLCAAYEANGQQLTVLEQPDQAEYTEAEDNYAYYRVDRCVFIKEADQVQLVFFYNNSTLERVSEELEISPVLPREQEVFEVSLLQCIDVTPADHTGDTPVIEELRIAPTACEVGSNSLYTFCRYTFDGVELDEQTVVVYLDIFYGEQELGTMRLYHAESRSVERDLTNKEHKSIKG